MMPFGIQEEFFPKQEKLELNPQVVWFRLVAITLARLVECAFLQGTFSGSSPG